MLSYHSRYSCWQHKRLSWLWMRMETRLASGVINRWTHLLTLVKGNRIHLLSLCKSNWSRLLTPCESSRRCLVFLRSRSTVTMRKRLFLLQNLLSLTRSTMSESGPRWMKVATPLVAARVGQLAQNDISTCLFCSRSIARAPETRFSLDLVAIRLPQLDVASFRLHLPSQLNVATSITCQALLSCGSCLVMDLSCSRSMRRPS